MHKFGNLNGTTQEAGSQTSHIAADFIDPDLLVQELRQRQNRQQPAPAPITSAKARLLAHQQARVAQQAAQQSDDDDGGDGSKLLEPTVKPVVRVAGDEVEKGTHAYHQSGGQGADGEASEFGSDGSTRSAAEHQANAGIDVGSEDNVPLGAAAQAGTSDGGVASHVVVNDDDSASSVHDSQDRVDRLDAVGISELSTSSNQKDNKQVSSHEVTDDEATEIDQKRVDGDEVQDHGSDYTYYSYDSEDRSIVKPADGQKRVSEKKAGDERDRGPESRNGSPTESHHGGSNSDDDSSDDEDDLIERQGVIHRDDDARSLNNDHDENDNCNNNDDHDDNNHDTNFHDNNDNDDETKGTRSQTNVEEDDVQRVAEIVSIDDSTEEHTSASNSSGVSLVPKKKKPTRQPLAQPSTTILAESDEKDASKQPRERKVHFADSRADNVALRITTPAAPSDQYRYYDFFPYGAQFEGKAKKTLQGYLDELNVVSEYMLERSYSHQRYFASASKPLTTFFGTHMTVVSHKPTAAILSMDVPKADQQNGHDTSSDENLKQSLIRQNMIDSMLQILQMGLNNISIDDDGFANQKIGFLQAWSANYATANETDALARNFKVTVGNPATRQYIIHNGEIDQLLPVAAAAVDSVDSKITDAVGDYIDWLDRTARSESIYLVMIEKTNQAWEHNIQEHKRLCNLQKSVQSGSEILTADNATPRFGERRGTLLDPRLSGRVPAAASKSSKADVARVESLVTDVQGLSH